MSLGTERLRVDFNPSGDEAVQIIKNKAAELVDFINQIPHETGEEMRLKSLAMTAIEEGAMWAVKAATA